MLGGGLKNVNTDIPSGPPFLISESGGVDDKAGVPRAHHDLAKRSTIDRTPPGSAQTQSGRRSLNVGQPGASGIRPIASSPVPRANRTGKPEVIRAP